MLFPKASPRDIDAFTLRLEEELNHHKSKYVFQGILFIGAGILAAVFPATTAINVEIMIGIILIAVGLAQAVFALKSHRHSWGLVSAVLAMGVGLFMLARPLSVLFAFVTLLAIFMSVEGVLELLLAFQLRPARNWSWMFASGLITLALALMLWVGFPVFGVLYLGCVIAINLILYGFSLIMLVWKSRELDITV